MSASKVEKEAEREWHLGRPHCAFCRALLDYAHPTNACDVCSRLMNEGQPPRTEAARERRSKLERARDAGRRGRAA